MNNKNNSYLIELSESIKEVNESSIRTHESMLELSTNITQSVRTIEKALLTLIKQNKYCFV